MIDTVIINKDVPVAAKCAGRGRSEVWIFVGNVIFRNYMSTVCWMGLLPGLLRTWIE